MIPESSRKTTIKRPPPSPLLAECIAHPQRITDALADAAPSIEQAKNLRRELHACGRGDTDPDAPGLRMVWAYMGLAGAHGLLDQQRAWHKLHGAKRGGVA